MKIAVMGTGGTGGYYGGLLATHGHEVSFIARGAHLEAIRQSGLQVTSVHGDFVVRPAIATDDPAQLGQMDLVLLCTKTYDTELAAQAIRPAIGPQTAILSLQNGIDAAERIGRILGAEHMLAGATWISSSVESPGVIRQISQFRRVVLGELDGRVTARAKAVQRAFQEAGVTSEVTEQILKVLWTKFVFICPASAFGSLTRLPLGDFRSVPETRASIISFMQEVHAVSEAHGVRLDPDVVEQSLKFLDDAAPHIKPSMQLDVEAGRLTELESMIGVVGRKGRAVGVPTPIADLAYAALLPVELRARN